MRPQKDQGWGRGQVSVAAHTTSSQGSRSDYSLNGERYVCWRITSTRM